MDGRFPFYYAPGSFPSQDFRHFHPTLAGQIQQPSRILLNRSDIPASVVSESDSPTSSGSAKGLAKKTKKQYEKWPQEEKKALVSLWAERHELLESKDARDLGRNCA